MASSNAPATKCGRGSATTRRSDRSDKRHAEDIAERVSGVRELHNNLRVSGAWDKTPGREPITTAGPQTAGTTSRR